MQRKGNCTELQDFLAKVPGHGHQEGQMDTQRPSVAWQRSTHRLGGIKLVISCSLYLCARHLQDSYRNDMDCPTVSLAWKVSRRYAVTDP